MQIRQAIDSDYAPLMELYNEFVETDRFSSHNNDSFSRVIKNPHNFVYVVEEGGKLIAFAAFSVRDVIRYPRPIAELDELFVSAHHRKKGIGSKLMEQIEKKAKELNCHRIFIESHYDRKAAHAFYEALDYLNYGHYFIKDL